MPVQETVEERYWCPGPWPWEWFDTCVRRAQRWCYDFVTIVPVVGFAAGMVMLIAAVIGWLTWPVSALAALFSRPKCNGPVYVGATTTTGERMFKAYPHGSASFPTGPSVGVTGNNPGCGARPDYRMVGQIRYELTPTPGDGPVVGRTPEHLDAFWVGPRNELMHTFWPRPESQGTWYDAFALEPHQSVQAGAVSAIARRPDHLDVFWIGRRGQLLHKWWDVASAGGWSPAYMLAGEAEAAPGAVSAVARHPERIDVFWITLAGRVMSTCWDNRDDHRLGLEGGQDWTDLDIPHRGWWSSPFEVHAGARAAPGAIRAVSRTLLSVDLLFIGEAGEVYWMVDWSDGAKYKHASHASAPPVWWAPIEVAPRGSAAPGGLALVARRDDRLDAFWIGPQGEVRHAALQHPGSGWSRVIELAPGGAAAPGSIAAVARYPEHLDIFWIGPSGEIRHMYWDGASGWSGMIELAPAGSAKADSICAVARRHDHLDIFFVAPDDALSSMAWDGRDFRWFGPFPVSAPGTAQPGW